MQAAVPVGKSWGFMVLLDAVEGVLSLLLMGLVGYILAWKGWFNEETKAVLPKLITYVSLPLFLIYSLTSTFKSDDLIHIVYGAVVPMLSMIICFFCSLGLGKILKVNHKHTGLFYITFTTSNAVFIGIPVNIALFGEQSLPYTLVYFFANTIFFWTVGNYYISADSEKSKVKLISIDSLKKIFSTPVIALLVSFLLILLQIKLPAFLLNTAKYLGNMTTPLAIILIGVILYSIDLKKIKWDRDLIWVMVGRFVISPLSILLVIYFIPVPELMRKVFIIQSSLPAMAQTAILASFYHTDVEYATLIVSVSTLASIITIPIFMILIS